MEKKMGRPTRDPGGVPSKIVPIRMTADEHAEFEAAASHAKLNLSAWVRSRLSKAAKRESKP